VDGGASDNGGLSHRSWKYLEMKHQIEKQKKEKKRDVV